MLSLSEIFFSDNLRASCEEKLLARPFTRARARRVDVVSLPGDYSVTENFGKWPLVAKFDSSRLSSAIWPLVKLVRNGVKYVKVFVMFAKNDCGNTGHKTE